MSNYDYLNNINYDNNYMAYGNDYMSDNSNYMGLDNDYRPPKNDYMANDNNNLPEGNPQINSYAGFIRGNLFDNLYEPYKKMPPVELKPTNEREALMLKSDEYGFAAHDLNLYLDNYPGDNEALKLFNNYRKLANTATYEYENMYGPIFLSSDAMNASPWAWDNSPWPWEGAK